MLDRLFKLRDRQTTVRTEIFAGMTTFIAMAYIVFVIPQMLTDAGIPKEAAIAATILITAISTLLMGVLVNYPVALAPGLGLAAFFSYYVCGSLELPWTVALGAVFFSGLVFLLLTCGGILQAIIHAVPDTLKAAITVGIGLFIAFIGLKSAGILQADPSTFVSLGDITQPAPVFAMFTLALTIILMVRGVQGSILISIATTTLISMALGYAPIPQNIEDIISFNIPSIGASLGQLDIPGAWNYGIISIIFTFTMVELFDNIGTLISLTRRANMVKDDGEIPDLSKALTMNAFATIGSAVIGTSTVTTYLESATGIEAGGRTGLTAVTVAVGFISLLLFAPLIALVPSYATASALILIGALMISAVKDIDFNDLTDGVPAFLTIIMMPLTYSIASGFAFGFISYVVLKVCTGRYKEVSWVMGFISLAFLINLIMRA
ncbi:MAG: NCS2 family permease [Selenomonas sp.]|uniref:NCS2 family permease n=1 Tax=Selenomonas sp. TaxID=2053611 RepID=UPI0025DE303A|nr:NCS2 family permease [Selenomonas sp.]MCR5758339.1 NCS2 family permease [Selenomonas sp.]